jgi:hypothetical protein
MDKNIFIKKYNPDVNIKFNDVKTSDKNFQKNKIEYKNELWKGITGKEFTNNVSKSEDFIIKFEKPDFNKISSIHSNEYMNRQREIKEIEEKNKKIYQSAMENVMKIQNNLGINEQENSKTHDELKKLQIKDNDVLKDEKEKFNELIKNLEDII